MTTISRSSRDSWRRVWHLIGLKAATWVLRPWFRHLTRICDRDGFTEAVVLSKDRATFDRTFTVGPRYHVTHEQRVH